MKIFIGILSAVSILASAPAMAIDKETMKTKVDPVIVLGSTAVGCGLGYLVANVSEYSYDYNRAPKILGGCVAGAAVGAMLVNLPEPSHAVDEAELKQDISEDNLASEES